MGCCNSKQESGFNFDFSPKNLRSSKIQSSIVDKETIDHSQSFVKSKSFIHEDQKDVSPFEKMKDSGSISRIAIGACENLITINNVMGISKENEKKEILTSLKLIESTPMSKSVNLPSKPSNDQIANRTTPALIWKNNSDGGYEINGPSTNRNSPFVLEESHNTNIKHEDSIYISENLSLLLDKESVKNILPERVRGRHLNQITNSKEKEINVNTIDLMNNSEESGIGYCHYNVVDYLSSSKNLKSKPKRLMMRRWSQNSQTNPGRNYLSTPNLADIVKDNISNSNKNTLKQPLTLQRISSKSIKSYRSTVVTKLKKLNQIIPELNSSLYDHFNSKIRQGAVKKIKKDISSVVTQGNPQSFQKKMKISNSSSAFHIMNKNLNAKLSISISPINSDNKKESDFTQDYETNINSKIDYESNFTEKSNLHRNGKLNVTINHFDDNFNLLCNTDNEQKNYIILETPTPTLKHQGSKLSLSKYGHLFGDVFRTEQNLSRNLDKSFAEIDGNTTQLRLRAGTNTEKNSSTLLDRSINNTINR